MAANKAIHTPGDKALRPATFPVALRILSGADFSRIFKKNVRSKDGCFTLLARVTEHEHARLGLAISVKSAGNAVQRNRLKRLVRESFRLNQHALPAIDIVVMARHGVTSKTNAALHQSLSHHWTRLIKQCAP